MKLKTDNDMGIIGALADTFLPLVTVGIRQVKALLHLLKADTMSAAVLFRLGVVGVLDLHRER
jgi:hypothetical protein